MEKRAMKFEHDHEWRCLWQEKAFDRRKLIEFTTAGSAGPSGPS
jgi:hypothetical protein